jgi:hypothetical protein
MVEFWACLGLGCTDREFLDRIKDPSIIGKSTVGEVVREYGFRLSLFGLAELERLLADDEIVKCMRIIYSRGCPPPRPCVGWTKSASSGGYEEYKKFHASLLKRLEEKP